MKVISTRDVGQEESHPTHINFQKGNFEYRSNGDITPNAMELIKSQTESHQAISLGVESQITERVRIKTKEETRRYLIKWSGRVLIASVGIWKSPYLIDMIDDWLRLF